jgi:hypothetical protein
MLNEEYIPPGKSVVGTCSLCSGPVTVHCPWHSIMPDSPQCERCGAIKKEKRDYGPTIPMTPRTYTTAESSVTTKLFIQD